MNLSLNIYFRCQALSDSGGTPLEMFSVRGNGAVTVAGTLAVTGAVTLSSTLAVSGAATITGAVALSNTLAVTGAVTLSSTLAVTDASTLSGAVTMGSTLNVRVNARVIGRVCCVVIACAFVLYVCVWLLI